MYKNIQHPVSDNVICPFCQKILGGNVKAFLYEKPFLQVTPKLLETINCENCGKYFVLEQAVFYRTFFIDGYETI